jgi:hypothetical protein
MLADGNGIGKQRVGRNPGGDRGKKGDQGIESYARRERQQAVVLNFPIGTNEDVLPPTPGNPQRPMRMAPAAEFGSASSLQYRRFLRRRGAWRCHDGMRPGPIVLEPEGINHARRHHNRGGKPGREIFESGTESHETD